MDKTSYILGGLDLLTQSAEKQKTNTYWTVIYIRQGIGIYLLESDLRPINQGDVIILPPKVSYSFAATELGDEYNVNIDAVVLRFDNAWLTNLLAVFRTLNEVVLKIREMADPYAVEGPKWMKLSALMDQLSSSPAAQRAVIILQILELISTPKDLIKILHTSPYQDISLKSSPKNQLFTLYSKHMCHYTTLTRKKQDVFCFFFDFFAIVEDYVEGSNISSIFSMVGIAVLGTFCLRISWNGRLDLSMK